MVEHYNERGLTDYTTVYDFFFMLDKAMKIAEKEKKAMAQMKAKNKLRKK